MPDYPTGFFNPPLPDDDERAQIRALSDILMSVAPEHHGYAAEVMRSVVEGSEPPPWKRPDADEIDWKQSHNALLDRARRYARNSSRELVMERYEAMKKALLENPRL